MQIGSISLEGPGLAISRLTSALAAVITINALLTASFIAGPRPPGRAHSQKTMKKPKRNSIKVSGCRPLKSGLRTLARFGFVLGGSYSSDLESGLRHPISN